MPKRRWAIRPCHFFRHLRHRNSACNPFSSAKPRTAGSCPASSSLWKRTSRLAVKPNAALAIWSCFFVHRRLARSGRDRMFGTLAGMVRCRHGRKLSAEWDRSAPGPTVNLVNHVNLYTHPNFRTSPSPPSTHQQGGSNVHRFHHVRAEPRPTPVALAQGAYEEAQPPSKAPEESVGGGWGRGLARRSERSGTNRGHLLLTEPDLGAHTGVEGTYGSKHPRRHTGAGPGGFV